MWDNIGEKLQKLAKALCWIGIVVSVIVGIIGIGNGNALTGFLYIIIGSLAAWIGSWSMYGLGIVVEYVEKKLPLNRDDDSKSNTKNLLIKELMDLPEESNK